MKLESFSEKIAANELLASRIIANQCKARRPPGGNFEMLVRVPAFLNLAKTPVVAFLHDNRAPDCVDANSSSLIMRGEFGLASPKKLWQL
jgi:hypothetical protein